MDIDAKIAEADLYMQHGLTENAYDVYRSILEALGDAPHPRRAEVEAKLESAAARPEDSKGPSPPPDEPIVDEYERRFDNCLGLIEAEFHSDALDELNFLLERGFRPGIVEAKIGECLLAMDETVNALHHLERASTDRELSREERLDILDRLADTAEKLGDTEKVMNALESIRMIDPEFRNASQRLENIRAAIEKFGRYYTLHRKGLLTEEQFDRAVAMSQQRGKSITTILFNDFEIEKEALGESLSDFFKCPFVEFNELEVGPTPKVTKGIKEHFWRANHCVPIRESKSGNLHIAAEDPQDQNMLENLRGLFKSASLQFSVALQEDIDKFIDFFYGKHQGILEEGDEDLFGELELVEDSEEEEETDYDLEDGDAEGIVVKVANRIIEEAYSRGVSDIHIESLAGRRGALVRFRIDGECQNFQTIPYNYKRALVSRFKILSKLDIAEKRLPQDGKIKFRTRRGRNIELRVATLPTVGGNEDVVLRILAGGDALPLKKIGLLEDNLETFKKLLKMPYGLVLVVGPTGSGKTTTLHAGLNFINTPEKKIWTVEDPVEIVQDGLRQVQVHQKINLDFARVLRAFLRADPDVIMVGETRDHETANTVIEAALTGHLVFSTLHTNSAPETVTRLLGMGIDPFNFADSLLGVLAQRLIKRLCPHCRKPYKPSDEDVDRILTEYGEHPTKPLDPDTFKGITLYRAHGCTHCQRSGYKGRIGIHELLVTDDRLKELIEKNAPVAQIREAALLGGMRTLKQDGIMKMLQGDTDMDQVLSATIK